MLTHPVVNEHKCRHGLNNDHRARYHAGIVATPGMQVSRGPVKIHRFLRLEDCGSRLERDAEDNFLSITDAALHAAGTIGCGTDPGPAGHEGIIVFGALQPSPGKAAANLKTLRRR